MRDGIESHRRGTVVPIETHAADLDPDLEEDVEEAFADLDIDGDAVTAGAVRVTSDSMKYPDTAQELEPRCLPWVTHGAAGVRHGPLSGGLI